MITEDILSWISTLPRWEQKLGYYLPVLKYKDASVYHGALGYSSDHECIYASWS
nr:MAG TPA: hypothetical protein [Caudoviricetes sp.]DAP89949.1 MAG TPA: hypothetical protein [Caudoviricetes sp.]